MLEIAICDDEPVMRKEISRHFSDYMAKRQDMDYRIRGFESGKQLLAWGLAAGLTVSNLGTAFAAYHVGTPGASERDEVISLTLNGEGGRFTVTPSGSNAAEKLTKIGRAHV